MSLSGSSFIGSGKSSAPPVRCCSSSGIFQAKVNRRPSSVREYSSRPALISRAIVDFDEPTGPCSRMMRFSVPYSLAAALKTLTRRISGMSSP